MHKPLLVNYAKAEAKQAHIFIYLKNSLTRQFRDNIAGFLVILFAECYCNLETCNPTQ